MVGTAAVAESAVARLARAALPRPHPPPLSVHIHIIGLILGIIGPLLAFSAFLVLRSAAHEQELMAHSVRERAREAASTIDHELGARRAMLFTLAASPHLQAGDLAAFRAEAVDAARKDGLAVTLTDPSGQELVDTRIPAGQALPMTADADDIAGVVKTGHANVSTLTRDLVTGDLQVSINVPVWRAGRIAAVLSLDVFPLIPRIVADLRLPSDWLVTVGDQDGRTVARTREASRFVGQIGRPEVLQLFHRTAEGSFLLVSRDGIPAYNAFAHIKFSGWTVAISIPDAVLFAPVRHSTWALILAGAFTVALALALAAVIGRRLAGSITVLASFAEAVGQGDAVKQPATGIRETDAVATALHLASERLRHSAQERAVLLDRTVATQEAERRRIARELHDSLGQYLTALRLGFGAIEPVCASHPEAQQRLTELKNLAANLGQELSRIAWELRPMALDDLGLRRAIIQYLEEWADRSRLRIDLEINLGDRRLPQPIETALFRVLQEAITNVVKHAGASHVGVIVTSSEADVRLIVEDDGKGFDIGTDAGGLELGIQHLGLLGVRERLALVGGTLDVESGAQCGTTVYVRIPL